VPEWDSGLLMELFRERLLARLVASHAVSEQLVGKLLAWRHPGFSAHVGEPIAPEEKRRLEDTAAYLVRNPLSLQKTRSPTQASIERCSTVPTQIGSAAHAWRGRTRRRRGPLAGARRRVGRG
jgi:hypothetical protein